MKDEHNKKIKRLAMQPIDFKAHKVMKRQNSFLPQLDDFGDIDDLDVLG